MARFIFGVKDQGCSDPSPGGTVPRESRRIGAIPEVRNAHAGGHRKW